MPIQTIKAHSSKIYGIDWSRSRRNEIITCSLDSTVKVWDTASSDAPPLEESDARNVRHSKHPVWRARSLPFGDGILSVPQRGGTNLELWSSNDANAPVHVFDGYSDIVKEFVWRTRGSDTLPFGMPYVACANLILIVPRRRPVPTCNVVKGPHVTPTPRRRVGHRKGRL